MIMKNAIVVIVFVFLVLKSGFSQNYQISFAADGDVSNVETVEVYNLTQGTNLVVNGTDILHLVDEISSIHELSESNSNVEIYPNPMEFNGTIKFSVSNPSECIIKVLNVEGKTQIEENIHLESGTHTFDLNGLQVGVYFVDVISSNERKSAKLLVDKMGNSNPTIKHTGISQSFQTKSSKETIQMQYNEGDLMLFKGISGDFSTVLTNVPNDDATLTFMFHGCTDVDGNNYSTVTIDSQVWMAEDLKVNTYPNGIPIPNITDNTEWGNLADNNTSDGYCFYDNNSDTDYGALYTYAAAIGNDWTNDNAEGQGICPDGWHLPTNAEWSVLINYLGGANNAGGKLKETGTLHWQSPNIGATNEIGFTALPGGGRDDSDGSFYSITLFNAWWSATPDFDSYAWFYDVRTDETELYSSSSNKSYGLSVRCVKD
jgi:uncharacterized protein (TIGR02145 family)